MFGTARNANRGPVEHLRYSIDVYDQCDNLIEVLARLADLDPARAAFDAAVAKYPEKLIYLRNHCRVVRRSNEPAR
jgi:hypothetical protein